MREATSSLNKIKKTASAFVRQGASQPKHILEFANQFPILSIKECQARAGSKESLERHPETTSHVSNVMKSGRDRGPVAASHDAAAGDDISLSEVSVSGSDMRERQ